MTDAPAPWQRDRMRRLVPALGHAFLRLAHALTASLARTLAWLWPTGPAAELRQAASETLPMVMWPNGRIAVPTRAHSDRVGSLEFEVVDVESTFSEQMYDSVIAQLQASPGSKLLDLRSARAVKMELFERLVATWHARRGAVPRLGIVFGYECWTVLHRVVARRLQPMADRGTEVEIFYPQQIESLSAWFAGGRVRHDHLRDVIEWLRTQWRPTAIWPTVLGTTAMLIQRAAETDAVPDMLLELAAVASSFEDRDGADHAARYASAAVASAGDQPSGMRCRALRALASATMRQGKAATALQLLEMAITTAAVIRDPFEEATAVTEVGFHALRGGHLARAEARFRCGLALLSAEKLPYLQATLHHHLALVLLEQHKDAGEAEHHAAAALALRWDKTSRLAEEDRALLARIRGHRPGQLGEGLCAQGQF